MMKNRKIFISYSDFDKEKAEALCEILEMSGFKCWIFFRDTIPGKSFIENILDAITNSDLIVVLFSEKAHSEKRMLQEVELGFDTEKPIIPIRIEIAELKGVMKFVLSTLEWIEAFEKPFEEYFPQIISAVNRYLEVEEQKKKYNQPLFSDPLPDSGGTQPMRPECPTENPIKRKEYWIYSNEYSKNPYPATRADIEKLEELSLREKGERFDIYFSEEKNEVIIKGKVKDFLE